MNIEKALQRSKRGDHGPLWALVGEFGVKSAEIHRHRLNLANRLPEDQAHGTAFIVMVESARSFKGGVYKGYYNSSIRHHLCATLRKDKKFPIQSPVTVEGRPITDYTLAPIPSEPLHSIPVSEFVKRHVLGCLTIKTRNILIDDKAHGVPRDVIKVRKHLTGISDNPNSAKSSIRSRIYQAIKRVQRDTPTEIKELIGVRDI